MFGRGFRLFEVFGFTVRVDPSWFLIALLLSWSLAVGYFPARLPGFPAEAYWGMGIAGAVGLFATILVHELCHSLAARRFGVSMRGITLFLFGGVAEMEDEPPSARAEAVVAVAGPIASLAIALLLFLIHRAGAAAGAPPAVLAVASYLATINVILVLFNLLPAFPLDGGRVLRAYLWHRSGNLRAATRSTTRVGGIVGFLLFALAGWCVFRGNLLGGVWYFLIGMFLRRAAIESYRRVVANDARTAELKEGEEKETTRFAA